MTESAPTAPAVAEPYERRWLALGVIAMTVLLVILDATIVNIALPAVSADLGISPATQQWIVTAYTLTFGGFLLLGGRSPTSGAASAPTWSGPAASPSPRPSAAAERGHAVRRPRAPGRLRRRRLAADRAVHRHQGARKASPSMGDRRGGSAVGLLLGGVLTEYADWRWCFWVNLPVAVLAIVLAIPIVPESKAPGDTSYDVPGAVLVTLGLASFVYGFTRVAQNAQENAAAGGTDSAWAEPWALFFIGAERCSSRRSSSSSCARATRCCRCGSCSTATAGRYLTSTLVGAGLIGAFFFLSLYFQQVLPYTPVEAGFASLPTTLGVLVSAGAASGLVPKVGPKPLMVLGGLLAAAGLF